MADIFMGMLPALLPEIRKEFGMTLVTGAALITTMYLVSNLAQVPIGHLRANKTKPLFLPMGMILAASMSLLVMLPRTESGEVWIFMLVVVSSLGTGLAHPEAFRAVHKLGGIAASTSTAVFMIGGMLGFGMGAWISTVLVSGWGMGGLLVLGPVSLGMVGMLFLLKIRLAVEEEQSENDTEKPERRTSFWPIWLMTIPTSIATTVILGLLPTRLEEIGFELEYGGFSNMLFISGAIVGTLFWAEVSRNRNKIGTSTVALILGIPFLLAHLIFIEHHWAAWILVPGGFCVMAAFPLLVTEARFALGLNLGGRMAMSAGGTWGAASVAFLLFGVMADQWGIEAVLKWMWMGYLASILIGLFIMRKNMLRNRN